MEVEVNEAEAKFNEEHKDEIEAALKWEQEQTMHVEEEYNEEVDDEDKKEDDSKLKEKPPVPVFDREEFLKKWLEENPVIEIPNEVSPQIDNDWILTEEEEQNLLNAYMSKDQN